MGINIWLNKKRHLSSYISKTLFSTKNFHGFFMCWRPCILSTGRRRNRSLRSSGLMSIQNVGCVWLVLRVLIELQAKSCIWLAQNFKRSCAYCAIHIGPLHHVECKQKRCGTKESGNNRLLQQIQEMAASSAPCITKKIILSLKTMLFSWYSVPWKFSSLTLLLLFMMNNCTRVFSSKACSENWAWASCDVVLLWAN